MPFASSERFQLNSCPAGFDRSLCCCRITVVPRRLHEFLIPKEGDDGTLDRLILQCGRSALQVLSILGPSSPNCQWRFLEIATPSLRHNTLPDSPVRIFAESQRTVASNTVCASVSAPTVLCLPIFLRDAPGHPRYGG